MTTKTRLFTFFIALVMACGLAVATSSQAQAGRALRCTSHWSTDYADVTRDAHHIQVGTEVYYRNCIGGGHGRFVDPLVFKFLCRPSGGLRYRIQDVRFNVRAWDFAGHGVNPAEITNHCDGDYLEWTEEVVLSPEINRLRRCAAGIPRWETDGKMRMSFTPDKKFTLSSTMWGYSGPTAVDC